MADTTILSGDIGVTYLGNNRQKRLTWEGASGTYTMNELYSAMATLLDETATIDDGTCFSAETPVEYTIGKIDTGDTEPWYVTFDLMEHMTGGALKTSGWTWEDGVNSGIVCVEVTEANSDISASDEGYDIVHTDGDTGTLVEYISNGGTSSYCIIRPDTYVTANAFDNTTGTLTCNTNDATVITTAATTGEQIWANLYSLGTIDTNVHLYIYQGEAGDDADRVRKYSWNDGTQDWYENGHINICVALKDITTAAWPTIDNGYITVFARKSGDLYASFEVSCSTTSGGRNPIPVQTAVDLDGGTGTALIATTGGWDTPYFDGEIITGNVTGARAIVDLENSDTSSEQYIVAHPIDDPQVDFTTSDTVITGSLSGAESSCTTNQAATGPALAGWFTNTTVPTIAFGTDTFDVDDDSTDEDYAVTIHCQSNPLTEIYEWIKYVTRNGATEQTAGITIYGEEGINGERYIGGEVYLKYGSGDAISGTMNEGDDVTQETTNATGVIVSINTSTKIIFLRDTRGTFATGSATSHTITSVDNSGFVEMDSGTDDAELETFAPKTSSPLGTFAGGTFFGARGVLLTNYVDADANSFILTPIEGGTKEAPTSITMTVTNLIGGTKALDTHDRVAIFRLDGDGGDVKKTEYNVNAATGDSADAIVVNPAISQDTVGKTAGGSLIIVKDPGTVGTEYKVRFDSWSGSTFSLSTVFPGSLAGGTNTTTIISSTDELDGILRGDLVCNLSQSSAVSYVISASADANSVTISPAISGQTNADRIAFNVIPKALDTGDDLYVPFIDRVATTDEESASVVYSTTIYYRAKVRNTRTATEIKPFSVDGTCSGSDVSIPTIRTEDTIIS